MSSLEKNSKKKVETYNTNFQDIMDEKESEIEFEETTSPPNWNHQKIKDLLSQLNIGISKHEKNLTNSVARGKMFQTKFHRCSVQYKGLLSEHKAVMYDKNKLQENLDEMQMNLNALQQVLQNLKSGIKENRQTNHKLTVSREECLQNGVNNMKTIENLRGQVAQLERKLSHYRRSKKNS